MAEGATAGLLSEKGVVSAASLQAVAELLQVGDAVEVDEGCRNHQDMEDLVGVELRRERERSEAAYQMAP